MFWYHVHVLVSGKTIKMAIPGGTRGSIQETCPWKKHREGGITFQGVSAVPGHKWQHTLKYFYP